MMNIKVTKGDSEQNNWWDHATHVAALIELSRPAQAVMRELIHLDCVKVSDEMAGEIEAWAEMIEGWDDDTFAEAPLRFIPVVSNVQTQKA